MLLSAGINVDATNSYGDTALMWAAAGGPIQTMEVRLLIGTHLYGKTSHFCNHVHVLCVSSCLSLQSILAFF